MKKQFYFNFKLLFLSHFLLFSLLSLTLLSQETKEWKKQYRFSKKCSANDLLETYDKGYLLAGWLKHNYPEFSYLAKTDINGNVLWKKVLGKLENTFTIQNIKEDSKGYIYISGCYTYKDLYGDPYLMKLSPCGVKVWCKVFYTSNHYDAAANMEILPNDEVLVTLIYYGGDQDKRICIARIDGEGQEVYKMFYGNSDEKISNEDDQDITLLPDNKVLLSGYCSYEVAYHQARYRMFYICADIETGKMQWEKVIDQSADHPLEFAHNAYSCVLSLNKKHLYCGGYRHLINSDPKVNEPVMLKMDVNGENYEFYKLKEGTLFSFYNDHRMVNDSLIIGNIGYKFELENKVSNKRNIKENVFESYNPERIYTAPKEGEYLHKAVLHDTLGQIKKEIGLTNFFSSRILKTSDNHYLFFTFTHPDEEAHPSAYLYKFDANLDWAVENTEEIEYDYLCDHEIPNDTIHLDDCVQNVGLQENKKEEMLLKAYPNPCNNTLHIQIPLYIETTQKGKVFQSTKQDFRYQSQATIQIIDINGQLMETITNLTSPTMDINTTKYPSGMYMLRLVHEGNVVGRAKFVVR